MSEHVKVFLFVLFQNIHVTEQKAEGQAKARQVCKDEEICILAAKAVETSNVCTQEDNFLWWK